MQGLRTILVSLCLIAFGTSVWCQSTTANHRTVPAQIDPLTGQFRLMQPAFEIEPNSAPITGKFVANFTITVSSTLSTSDVIACGVSSVVLDVASSFELLETATVAATRTGSTAKCTVTIPYSWILLSSTSDMVLLSYNIVVPATTAGSQFPNRTSDHGFANIKVPATGTTTTFNLTPTI